MIGFLIAAAIVLVAVGVIFGPPLLRRRRLQRLREQPFPQGWLPILETYAPVAKHMPEDRIVVIDGQGTVDDVHRRIHEAYVAAFR